MGPSGPGAAGGTGTVCRLAVQRRDRAREQRADELALWAYQFSPRISFEPSLLLLGRCQPAPVRRPAGAAGHRPARTGPDRLQRAARPRDDSDRSRPAGTQPARLPGVDQGRPARNGGGAAAGLHLTRDPVTRDLVRHIGLTGIADVPGAATPELARRSGPQLPQLLDRLLGEAPDPRQEWHPPQHFSQTIELLGEIGQTTALLFPARRLMVALCGSCAAWVVGPSVCSGRCCTVTIPDTVRPGPARTKP